MRPTFNATEELEAIRKRKALCRRRRFKKNRLERYRAELIELRQSGASYRELSAWIRTNKRWKVDHSVIRRWMIKLPEMEALNHG